MKIELIYDAHRRIAVECVAAQGAGSRVSGVRASGKGWVSGKRNATIKSSLVPAAFA